MLGQRARKEAPGRKCRILSSLIVLHVSNVFWKLFALIVYCGGNYGKYFTICHLKVAFTEYYRVLVLFYKLLTYCWRYSFNDCILYIVYIFIYSVYIYIYIYIYIYVCVYIYIYMNLQEFSGLNNYFYWAFDSVLRAFIRIILIYLQGIFSFRAVHSVVFVVSAWLVLWLIVVFDWLLLDALLS